MSFASDRSAVGMPGRPTELVRSVTVHVLCMVCRELYIHVDGSALGPRTKTARVLNLWLLPGHSASL